MSNTLRSCNLFTTPQTFSQCDFSIDIDICLNQLLMWSSSSIFLSAIFKSFNFTTLFFFSFFKILLGLFLERGEGREKDRERNINMWLPLPHPQLGTWPTTRHVPWLGIELATLWFTGQHSVHWATPARAQYSFLKTTFCAYDLFCFFLPFICYSYVFWGTPEIFLWVLMYK